MEVPFVDLTRQGSTCSNSITEAVHRVMNSGVFVLGPEVREFEEEFADYCARENAVGVASGTDALLLAMRAAGIGGGDEVIIAATTFIATFHAVSMCGATPVPVDVDPDYYCMDPGLLEPAITARTRAIIPVHIYGQVADMDGIVEVADEKGIPVIEDACQAHGALYRGRVSGSFGQAACFSFYPTKNLGCLGDGGIVVTDDSALAQEIRRLREYGGESKYHYVEVGVNSRLDEIQAAVLRLKLRELDEYNRLRGETAAWYRSRLGGLPQVKLPAARGDGSLHVHHLFVIRCERRDSLRDFLEGRGVHTGIHYPVPPHLQGAYGGLGYREGDFPVTEELAKSVLSLPIFPGLTEEEIEYVCENIIDFYRGG